MTTLIRFEDEVRGSLKILPADEVDASWRAIIIDEVHHSVARWVLSGKGERRRLSAFDAEGKLIETRVGTVRKSGSGAAD